MLTIGTRSLIERVNQFNYKLQPKIKQMPICAKVLIVDIPDYHTSLSKRTSRRSG